MIGVTPIREAADPTEAGTVKVVLSDPGIGVVPVQIVASEGAGVVPVEFTTADVGVIPVTTSWSIESNLEVEMRRAVVSLSNDQILALPTTPVEIVPAPGPGKMILLIAALIDVTINVALSNLSNDANPASTSMSLVYGNDNQQASSYLGTGAIAALGSESRHLWPLSLPHAVTSNTLIQSSNWTTTNDVENQALNLLAYNDGLDDFEDGDDTNSMTVTVLYEIIDVP